MSKGIVYDASIVSRILGIPVECSGPVPQAKDGEIVIYYGGWDLKQLRTCIAANQWMYVQDWYDPYELKAEPGYYRLLLPVPDSNSKMRDAQMLQLAALDGGWKPAPICIATTALIVHWAVMGGGCLSYGLSGESYRCAEEISDDHHVSLVVYRHRVGIDDRWDKTNSGILWLAAARKA
jgi:hypothetical protein